MPWSKSRRNSVTIDCEQERAISLAATAVILTCIAWLAATGLAGRVCRSAQLLGAATAGLLPLSFSPVRIWFVLMRVDMLAIALTFLGVVFAVRATRRPAWLVLAMPLFVLAVYTKQTEIAAPASALAVLLMVKPRAAIFAGLGGGILGLSAFLWLEWQTAGGFGRHILAYNVNTASFDMLASHLRTQAKYAILLVAAVVGLAVFWTERGGAAGRPNAVTAESRVIVPMVSVWLMISIAMLTMVAKIGANVNYFIEPMCVCAVPAGMLVGRCWQAIVNGLTGRRDVTLLVGLVCQALALAAEIARGGSLCVRDWVEPGLIAVQKDLVRDIAGQVRPVLSEDMVLSLRGGQEVPIELAIFHELSRTGQWDQRRILDLIDAHAFAFVITTPDKVYTPQRYTPEMLAAIARAYPRVETHGPYVVQYPEGP